MRRWPPLATANGFASITITVTVRGSDGTGRAGDPVAVALSGTGRLGPVVDNGDGTYSATYITSTAAGPVVVTASDGGASRQLGLMAAAGAPARVTSAVSPASVSVSGSSPDRVSLSVVVTDAYGNLTDAGALSVVTSGDAVIQPGGLELSVGSYLVGYQSSHTIGDQTVTATLVSNGASVVATVVVHQVS